MCGTWSHQALRKKQVGLAMKRLSENDQRTKAAAPLELLLDLFWIFLGSCVELRKAKATIKTLANACNKVE